MGTVSSVLRTVAQRVTAVKERPKVITIERARACCENATQVAMTEVANYANSLAMALFEAPPPRQAGSVLQLGIPPALISWALSIGLKAIPKEFAPLPPLRVFMPNDLSQSYFEVPISADPSHSEFTTLLAAVNQSLQRLHRARNKSCMELNGLNPSNPRRYVRGGHQTRSP